MDVGRENLKEVQIEDSWIPKTPFKPILPKPHVIYTNRQGNQLYQANGSGSKPLSTGLSQETRDGMSSACSNSAVNGNLKAALGAQKGIAGDTVETCVGLSINGTAKWNFTSLLAFQDQTSAATTVAASYKIEDFPLGSNHSSINDAQATPHEHAYDLNLPPGGAADGKTTSQFQIIPLTPEKDATTGCRQLTQMQHVYTYQKENQERNEENGTATLDNNRFQTDTELHELTNNTSAAICTLIEENHNPGNAGSHAISLNETPQQKPKRKRHRPKVITEGKPRTKPVTAKPSTSTVSPTGKRKYVRKEPLNKAPTTTPAESKDNPTGKRRYVRKKPLNKASTTTPLEVTGGSIDPKALEPANKSCRRSLNFDIEGKPGEDSSDCRLNNNKHSEPQGQDVSRGNQSKSTVSIGQGIEVLVEATQAGIPYDLADSVNQMLKDYMSFAEKQAPSTPLPKQTYNSRGKGNDNFQDSHAKVEVQVTTHTVQQNTTQIILPADTQLPSVNPDKSNSSSCTILTDKGKANGSKRKLLNFVQQPDSCNTNLTGIHYNSLPAYQIMFPSIFKKKRTEKGQCSTISSTSCVTAAEDMGRQEEMCPQKDASGDPSTSTSNCMISASHSSSNEIPGAHGETGGLQCELQTSGPGISQRERSTRKRSKGPNGIQGLASVAKVATDVLHCDCTTQVMADKNEHQVEDSNRPQTCIEALVAEMRGTLTTKKRTKKRFFLVNSTSSSTNGEQSNGRIILYNQHQFLAKSLGTPQEVIWRQMSPVDAIVEQLQHLDINRESDGIAYSNHSALVPYKIKDQPNALVLYRRDGSIIPSTDAFEPIKKRRPRPKVYLDEETNRVWKLLLGNINSEGIDGTDEEKAKWWEEEREVFRGRTDSFIARMHLVQGDRRFSQWKGSVVDSVIGVFLTQNVSDHLSSSAFMALAARFPLKSGSNTNPFYEEGTSSVIEKPIVCMPDLEEAIKWNEMSNHSICDQSSMTLHDSELDEEQEVVNSNESSTSSNVIISSTSRIETYYQSKAKTSTTETTNTAYNGNMEEKKSATDDVFSSQNSVILSQNSVDSPSAQIAERRESFPRNNSEVEDLIDRSKFIIWKSSSSFMELLIKAGSNKLNEEVSEGNGTILSNQNPKDEHENTQNAGNDFHTPKIYNVDSPKSSLEASVAPSTNCHLHHIPNLGGVGVEFYKMSSEERRVYEVSNNSSRNSMKEPSSFISESGSQTADDNNLTVAPQEASRSPTPNNPPYGIQEGQHITTLSQSKPIADRNIVSNSLDQTQNNEMQKELCMRNAGGTLDIVESSSALNEQENNSQRTESDLIEHGFSEIKEINDMNAANRKAKSRRVGKEIRENVDWDALRKQAEAKGKRQRTPNTMDSLDWEALRCADVNDIAETIKDRGMNNVLAERIKNFLNRLVRDHGSIDLEWLRDIPPDKAKEYLLSVRGLGLKSVECVRLLTLQHLAFPVDTNVGRIAVRLGWVPLQPLPESLQLHLLELYPVLESIQKYIWPRLCKLDQRTLYELHYQMITFGKVFCTKSKPNCNACPMRGECRHFASAFASARLALPGPDEKSIVSSAKNSTNEQNPAVMVEQVPLLLPQATEQSEGNQLPESNLQLEARYGVSNCEPIVEEPSSPEPECPQVTENDMEDALCEDPDEIPTIKLNIEEFTQNLQNYMQENMELQEGDMSKALVALTAEAASIPTPKLKNVSQLRTEHHVYELPDSHPLLQGLERREPDDPCSYLLAIWTPGEMANSVQPPESRCNSQEYGKLCDEKTCFSCNSVREANSQIVRGTLLIPCRTAMRGSFPLNGTYFQVNEVFADHDSSLNPIDVPRTWIWNLPRRTVYFGTSIPTIFKGMTTEAIQHCFWRGYVCVRGFDQKTRAPRPLMARLHFPASKLNKTRGRGSND